MTRLLFRDDAYLQSCTARIIDHIGHGVVLDQTVFYATAGGQAGDIGVLETGDGQQYQIATTIKDRDSGSIVHVIADGQDLPAIDASVIAHIDWEHRHRLMRFHTALHLMCALIKGSVTGGNIAAHKARLDFDLPDEAPDKDELAAQLNDLIARKAAVYAGEISVAELKAKPDLVRTMSVQPPMDGDSIRTVTIEGIDYQPCGGTHVRNTGEIGRIIVSKVEKKGRQNRRFNIIFDE